MDFLLSGRNAFKSSVLYEYEDTVFKWDIIKKIRDIFEIKGFMFRKVDYSDFKNSTKSVSLFGGNLILLDLNVLQEENKQWETELSTFVKDLISGGMKNRFIILHRTEKKDIKVKSMEIYTELCEYCYFINEVKLNRSSVDKIIRVVMLRNKSLLDLEALLEKDIFLKSLNRYLEYRDGTLRGFVKFCEEISLLCVDKGLFNLGLFNLLFNERIEKDHYILHKLLFNLISNPNTLNKDRIFVHLQNVYSSNEYSSRLVVYRIMRALKELMYINVNLGVSEEYLMTLMEYRRNSLANFNALPSEGILRFSLLFAKYESLLNSDNILYHLNNFFSDFIG